MKKSEVVSFVLEELTRQACASGSSVAYIARGVPKELLMSTQALPIVQKEVRDDNGVRRVYYVDVPTQELPSWVGLLPGCECDDESAKTVLVIEREFT